MKKILGGILIVLCIVLIGNVKAETLDSLGSRNITSTIKTIDTPTYDISLTWEAFEFDYSFSADGGRIWNGKPVVTIYNGSNVPVTASFSWTPTITGTGMQLMHETATCGALDSSYNDELADSDTSLIFYTDSSCTNQTNKYNVGTTYYGYIADGEEFYDSLTSGTTYYNGYINMNMQATANGLLNSKKFIINGDKLLSNDDSVVWAPLHDSNSGNGVAFALTLADTQKSRDTSNMHSGDTIGTLAITIGGVE